VNAAPLGPAFSGADTHGHPRAQHHPRFEASDLSALRDRWLAHGLNTAPADRTTTEAAVAELYSRVDKSPPEFVWTNSPQAAVPLILAATSVVTRNSESRANRRIAGLLSNSRRRVESTLSGSLRSQYGIAPPDVVRALTLTLDECLTEGIGLRSVIGAGIRDSLHTSLFGSVVVAIRRLVPSFPGVITWYGQQEAHRLAHVDAARRLGLLHVTDCDSDLLQLQNALCASTGWWWPFDDVCILAERPVAIHTEPTPEGTHSQRRLHHDSLAAVEFRDGAAIYAVHGTLVPDWVMTDPTPERIGNERNIEIRRTAIERIGWDAYIGAAGLRLVDRSDDPGNPGHPLELYSTPSGWRTNAKILLVVNGSRERDGTRRRYGLQVPGWTHKALDAAAWTYGLTTTQYANLQRRT